MLRAPLAEVLLRDRPPPGEGAIGEALPGVPARIRSRASEGTVIVVFAR